MAKQFEATWSTLYEQPGTRIVGIEFFRDPDKGYDAENVQQIETMEVGVVLKLDGADHTVKRVADV